MHQYDDKSISIAHAMSRACADPECFVTLTSFLVVFFLVLRGAQNTT